MNNVSLLLRVGMAILAGLGLVGVIPVVYAHMSGASLCPMMGLVPVCYVVFVSYSLVFGAVVWPKGPHSVPFLLGWVVVFGMALFGTMMELNGKTVCPRTSGGTPACYYSLGMSALLVVLFLLSKFVFSTNKKSS